MLSINGLHNFYYLPELHDMRCKAQRICEKLSYTHDDMLIVKKMKEIVPEYKSQVSKYEVLDYPKKSENSGK